MKRNNPMSLEQCAAMMQRFLNRPPRKSKTRGYVATLPKRKLVAVSTEEYQRVLTSPVAHVRDEQRYRERVERGKPPSPSAPPRKDRRRASAMTGPSALDVLKDAASDYCGICGRFNDLWDMDIDHVVPRAAGGANVGNRVAAHRLCNRKKADRLPTGCELLWLMMVNAKLGIDIPIPLNAKEIAG